MTPPRHLHDLHPRISPINLKMKLHPLILMTAFALSLMLGFAFAADITVAVTDNAQQKIDASAAGDKITIADGYSTGGITLKSDRDYVIPRIVGTNASGFTINARGLKNAKLDLLLANANMDISGAALCTINVRGKDFKSRPGDAARHSVYFDGLDSCTVRGLEFRDMLGGDTCIFGWNPKSCIFEDFNGYSIHEGIHIFGGDAVDKPGNNIIRRVFIDGIRRHGVELQNVWNTLLVDTVYVTGRTDNGMDLSCATGGKPGQPGNGTTNTSWNVRINNCAFDQSKRNNVAWSQNAGIEAMGQITITNCWFANTGQGVLYGAVGPDWTVKNCKFKNVSQPLSGEPIAFTFPPKTANFTTRSDTKFVEGVSNDIAYAGAMPTYAQLLANQPPTTQPIPPVIPPAPGAAVTNLVTTAGYSTIDLRWMVSGTGTILIQRYTKNGMADATFTIPPVLASGSTSFRDTQFSPSQVSSHWEFYYVVAGTKGTLAQLGMLPPPPPPPPPAPSSDLVMVGTFNGKQVQVIYQQKADGTFAQPTTRPTTMATPSN